MKRSPLRPRAPARRAARGPSGPAIRGYTPPTEPVRASVAPRGQGDAIEKPVRLRSRFYLDGVKLDPCEAAGIQYVCEGPIDPHHVKVRGMRGDDFDFTAIPLCRRHHGMAHRSPDADLWHRLLGSYLVRKLPLLSRSAARRALQEMLDGLE